MICHEGALHGVSKAEVNSASFIAPVASVCPPTGRWVSFGLDLVASFLRTYTKKQTRYSNELSGLLAAISVFFLCISMLYEEGKS